MRVLRRMAWLGVLIAGAAAYLLVLHTLVATQNPNFFPSLILLGSITVPLAVLVFAGEAHTGTAVGPVVTAALAGGVIGTVAAGTWEYDALHRMGTLPAVGIGLIEETAKLIVPVVLLFVMRHRTRVGVVVGIASGMGFATLETMGYGFTALLRAGSLAAVDQTLLLRALLAPAGHVAWTGLTAAAIWAIPGAARRGRAVLLAIGTFVLAVVLHACWDGINSWPAHLVIGIVSLGLLLVVLHRSRDRSGSARTDGDPGETTITAPRPQTI